MARDCLSACHGRVVVQPRRLGWVRNTNAALRMAEGSHAMVMPHDDVLLPSYVSACMGALSEEPEAIVAFTDISVAGESGWLAERSETGPAAKRVANILTHHFNAVAWRGVFSRKHARRHSVPQFAVGDFAADTLWVARMAAQGAIVRVPAALYRKRFAQGSVHSSWFAAAGRDHDEIWAVHCAEMLLAIASARPGLLFDPGVRNAVRSRLAQEHVQFGPGDRVPGVAQSDSPWTDMVKAYSRATARRPVQSWTR